MMRTTTTAAVTAATATEGTTASSPHDVRPDGRPDHGAAAARTEELYRDHGRLVGGLCRALLRDSAEAEDAVQQVFLAAHRALLNGTTPREPAAWLATIARNECWARIRARMREPLPTDEVDGAASTSSDPLAQAIRNADLAALWSAVAELPRQQRDALLLRELNGLSYEELAGALAVSGSAVESLLFRARQSMRTRLEAAYAGLTGASWIEALSRLAGGIGSGMAPVAAKVAVVGAGAAVVTGGAVVAPTMLEHVRHAQRASAHPARTTKAERPARVAQRLPIFVARTTPRAVVAPTPDSRGERDASDLGRSGGKDGTVRGDDHSGRDRSSGSSGTSSGSDGSGDVRETAESTSRSGHGDGSGSGGDDGSSSRDGDGSLATGSGSGSSGGRDSSDGGSGSGSSGGGGSGGEDGSHGGDSGSDDGGVVTTIPNPVVTVTVASGDAPPALGAPPPGNDG